MPLPILQVTSQPTPETLVRLFHQTEMHWTQHIAENEEVLEMGTAFSNPTLAEVWDANRILGALLPEGMTAEHAVDDAESHYRQKGTRLCAWVMSPSAMAVQTDPLVQCLLSRGYQKRSADILHLDRQPVTAIREIGGFQVIPARASFRHARQLAEESSRRWGTSQLIEASVLHLDDPHVDALLALKDGIAAAGVKVLAAGEVGRIEDVYVAERFRRIGLGRTMMSRALEICARSLFKHVMLSVAAENTAARALYDQIGFRKIGEFVTYQAPAVGSSL